jgi:hypothetical protein
LVITLHVYAYFFLIGFITQIFFGWFAFIEVECNSKWTVDARSRLQINGQTNVNSFECLSVKYEGQDTIYEYCDEQGIHYYNGKIKMHTNGFDCQHPVMSRDFRKTLKAEEFPFIEIEFLNLKTNPAWNDNSRIVGKVQITMAGKTKDYILECKVTSDVNGQKYLAGSQLFRFSEFGLNRPEKFFGAIKVKDEVVVDFNLKMNEANAKNW